MDGFKIVNVNAKNAADYPQIICFINAKHPTHPLKMDWLKERFAEGLKIKLLFKDGENKAVGFIEYIPGEYAWRAVSAAGYMFIHCLWISSNALKNKGLGSALIQECIQDAQRFGNNGVAVLCSNDAFMAKPDVFIKNGFRKVESTPSKFDLMVYKLKEADDPHINNWQEKLQNYQGLHLLYTKQCPWVIRFVSELSDYLKEKKISIQIQELKTATETQNAPSAYASFNLIYNGKLLADHYISMTRFANILKKEKLGI